MEKVIHQNKLRYIWINEAVLTETPLYGHTSYVLQSIPAQHREHPFPSWPPHSAKSTTILIILHKLKTSESSLTLPFSSHTYLVSQHSCLYFLQNVVHVHFIPLPHCTRRPQHIMPKLFHCFHWSFPSRLQFNYSLIPPENQHPACSACHARQGSISLSQLNFGT